MLIRTGAFIRLRISGGRDGAADEIYKGFVRQLKGRGVSAVYDD
jgi:hypothetical protein